MKLDLSTVSRSKNDLRRKINLPTKLTAELAELIGILIGDGCIGVYKRKNANGCHTDYLVVISFNQTEDFIYVERNIIPLIEKLFNVKPKVRYGSNAQIILRSKAIVYFLNRTIGLPIGKKAEKITIPRIIKSNRKFTLACVRGIFDTDFALSFRKKGKKFHHYPIIYATIRSRLLRDELYNILKQSGFENCYTYNSIHVTQKGVKVKEYDIYISGRKELDRWMKLIGSNNPKNTTKYEIWRKTGSCPVKTTIKQRYSILRSYKNFKS